jgi:ribonuclease Z
MSLLGRTAPLHLYAPIALEGMIQQMLDVADTVLCYQYFFHPLPEGAALLVTTNTFSVSCFPVEHRIPCHGFLIQQKTKGRKILPDKCREYEIPRYYYDALKQGADYERKDGTIIKNELLTTDGPTEKKYAYCADTVYTDSFIEYITGADTIYHESTYMERDADKAAARFHTTAMQAAQIAVKAGTKQLLLGHYSSKYRDTELFREEAATIFPNVQATVEGHTYDI